MCVFFFFKQKTAYEMRISDWSSDVCSSDLPGQDRPAGHGLCAPRPRGRLAGRAAGAAAAMTGTGATAPVARLKDVGLRYRKVQALDAISLDQIGRASGRERGWPDV